MVRIVILFVASFIALSFWINAILFIIPIKILDHFNAGRNARIAVLSLVVILSSVFITVPICNRIARDNEKDIARRERIEKEIIRDDIEEFLQENSIYLSDQKIDEIAKDIYDRKEFVNNDDVGFYIKERYLKTLLITLK